MLSLRGSSRSRDQTQVSCGSCTAGELFTADPLGKPGFWRSIFQFSSVAKLCPALCNPMGFTMPGFPVYHQLPELAPTHVHRVGDAIQPSHPLSSIPFSSCLQSFPASGAFQWVSSLHQVAKVLEFQLQHQSFQWIFRTDFPQNWLVGSPCSPRDSK